MKCEKMKTCLQTGYKYIKIYLYLYDNKKKRATSLLNTGFVAFCVLKSY